MRHRDSVARSLLRVSAGGETMSTPIGSHHGGNGSDSGSVNALLSIDAEAKAKIRTLVVDD
jgi:hypothetical protein